MEGPVFVGRRRPEAEHGVERDIADAGDVARLVRMFYRAVIPDPVLGPVFDQAGVPWDHHIPLLCSFWERQLFGTGDYAGNVAAAHGRLFERVGFGLAHLERWVELFDETVDELFSGPVAERAKHRARGGALVVRRVIERAST